MVPLGQVYQSLGHRVLFDQKKTRFQHRRHLVREVLEVLVDQGYRGFRLFLLFQWHLFVLVDQILRHHLWIRLVRPVQLVLGFLPGLQEHYLVLLFVLSLEPKL